MRSRAEHGVGELWTGHVLGVETGTSLAGGRYVVGPLLGRGGMAEVRRATDTALNREVAVKMFRHDLDEGSAERVRTETRTLAAMCHPGLVALHDAGTTTDADGVSQPYLVMELVDGPTLASAGVLPPERVAEVGRDIAGALAYVHAQGVIHRDVKPANILLSPSGAKLADFGIARVLDGARHTGTGLTVGTAPFLSPEQVAGDGVGPASDVYALGLALLESLTGTREYDGPPVEAALARLNHQPHVPPTLPAPWPALLTRMTARDPNRRPSAADVSAVLGGEPLASPATAVFPLATPTRHVPLRGAPTGMLPMRTVHTPWWRAHGAAPVIGLVGVLGLLGALLAAAGSSSPERQTPTVPPVQVTTPSPTAVPARVVVTPTKAPPVAPQPAPRKKGHGRGKHSD